MQKLEFIGAIPEERKNLLNLAYRLETANIREYDLVITKAHIIFAIKCEIAQVITNGWNLAVFNAASELVLITVNNSYEVNNITIAPVSC